jgi:hypothetical protein
MPKGRTLDLPGAMHGRQRRENAECRAMRFVPVRRKLLTKYDGLLTTAHYAEGMVNSCWSWASERCGEMRIVGGCRLRMVGVHLHTLCVHAAPEVACETR